MEKIDVLKVQLSDYANALAKKTGKAVVFDTSGPVGMKAIVILLEMIEVLTDEIEALKAKK